MAILEYSAERHLQYEKEDSYNSGYDNGYGTGFDNGQINGHSNGVKDTTALFSWLKNNNREADILRAVDDPDYLSALFDDFSKVKP